MIKPKCNEELEDFGAIMFSPPNSLGMVLKSHFCKKCYLEIMFPKKENNNG